jgi:hypothetical protein
MRNFGLDVRAGGPRRSHASSLRSRFCRRASAAAACRSARPWPARPGRVPALVRPDTHAVGDLPGAGAHRVEEPPVVGDHHQRAAPRSRRCRQPGDPGDVQVVGGLVEHQQVGVGPPATRPAPPAGAPRRTSAHRGVQPQPGQAEAGEDPRTAASPAHSCSAAKPASSQAAPSTTSPTVAAGSRSSRCGRAATRDAAHGGSPDRRPAAPAGEQPQQGGLAGTVEPDHTRPGRRSSSPSDTSSSSIA